MLGPQEFLDQRITDFWIKEFCLSFYSYTSKVWKQCFWMKCFGAPTPKRSSLWSNSRHIGVFGGRKLQPKKGGHQPELVKRYRDPSGRKRFQGNRKNLKKSGTHG